MARELDTHAQKHAVDLVKDFHESIVLFLPSFGLLGSAALVNALTYPDP